MTAVRKICQLLLGLVFVSGGLYLLRPALKPYVYLAAARPAEESAHPLKNSRSRSRLGIEGGRLFIPEIKLNLPLVESMARSDSGAYWRLDSSRPGEKGNAVFTGHNYFHGDLPLFSLLHLTKKEDEIIVHSRGKRFAYRVAAKHIVVPRMVEKYRLPTTDERLTLVTCYPPTSAAMRLVVIAKPVGPKEK